MEKSYDNGSVVLFSVMILARTLFAKLRPKRPSPREIQEKIDVSRTAALTLAYANRGLRVGVDDVGSSIPHSVDVDRLQLEKEVKELSADEARKWVQASLNDQIVSYFKIVKEVGGVHPQSMDSVARAISVASVSPSARQKGSVSRRSGETKGQAIERAALDSWRTEQLKEVLRERLGFCTTVKESSIPGAGAGLFVEGSAPEGAIVAIYPGLVHLPENLQHETYMSQLLPDDNFYLMGRADGCVIDARTRAQLPSSPLAMAHAVNHPPAGRAPNVLQAAYDYPSKTGGGGSSLFSGKIGQCHFPEELRPLIPNRYHKPPKLFGGKVERWAFVETVVLVACRGGVHDEEVFMDYRFNPSMRAPDWYTAVNPKEIKKMWGSPETRPYSDLSELARRKDDD